MEGQQDLTFEFTSHKMTFHKIFRKYCEKNVTPFVFRWLYKPLNSILPDVGTGFFSHL